jgi:hypothetical protein
VVSYSITMPFYSAIWEPGGRVIGPDLFSGRALGAPLRVSLLVRLKIVCATGLAPCCRRTCFYCYCFHGIGPAVSNPAWGVALTPHLHGIAARTTYQHLTHPHCWELASLSILRAITTGAFRFHESSPLREPLGMLWMLHPDRQARQCAATSCSYGAVTWLARVGAPQPSGK